MKITMDKKSEDYRQVKRANQCFLWCILFEVAGIMTMLFGGSIGAQLAIYFMTFVFAFGMARKTKQNIPIYPIKVRTADDRQSNVFSLLLAMGMTIVMHTTFNGINVLLSYANLERIPNWIITMSFLMGVVGFLIMFVWLLSRNPVLVEKGRYKKRNLITKEGVISLLICLCVMSMLFMM